MAVMLKTITVGGLQVHFTAVLGMLQLLRGYQSFQPSPACSLVHSELSWWGLKSFLHLHVAHTHYGSHYSFRYVINITNNIGQWRPSVHSTHVGT
jgi:hypothetical protein